MTDDEKDAAARADNAVCEADLGGAGWDALRGIPFKDAMDAWDRVAERGYAPNAPPAQDDGEDGTDGKAGG